MGREGSDLSAWDPHILLSSSSSLSSSSCPSSTFVVLLLPPPPAPPTHVEFRRFEILATSVRLGPPHLPFLFLLPLLLLLPLRLLLVLLPRQRFWITWTTRIRF